MATSVLEISDLTKRYGKLTALAGLDLTLHDGTVHGLVGPNGAGKTTMLLIISGLKRKTSGAENDPLGWIPRLSTPPPSPVPHPRCLPDGGVAETREAPSKEGALPFG